MTEQLSYVYEIVNKINGKFYVGKTVNLKARKATHFSHARRGFNGPLYAAIRKYGEDNFEFEVIAECPNDLCAQEHELMYIRLFEKSQLYNIRSDRIQGPRKAMGNRWSGIKATDIYPLEIFSMSYKEAKKLVNIPKTTWHRNRKKILNG